MKAGHLLPQMGLQADKANLAAILPAGPVFSAAFTPPVGQAIANRIFPVIRRLCWRLGLLAAGLKRFPRHRVFDFQKGVVGAEGLEFLAEF